jgi:hypothetical protein
MSATTILGQVLPRWAGRREHEARVDVLRLRIADRLDLPHMPVSPAESSLVEVALAVPVAVGSPDVVEVTEPRARGHEAGGGDRSMSTAPRTPPRSSCALVLGLSPAFSCDAIASRSVRRGQAAS